MKTLISLFDYTGNWSEPYKKAKWEVICIDKKHGNDIVPAACRSVAIESTNISL